MHSTLPPGTKLGRYEIRSQLGAGGMCEVYLAHDTKLERTVALKVLPASIASNKKRMHRFKQEAKTASGLNHPNIITIYEIEQADSIGFIAMEFVDGLTLRQRVQRTHLKITDALGFAVQIADALQAAHEVGVVHRDIKPENIMVRRRDGYIKVLDFGLAKLTEFPAAVVNPEAPTKTLVKTDPGVVLGTAQYMSPEQARGFELDARTDIWSLGCVLYEMVAGRSPFEGETSSDALASILEREPVPLARYARDVPETLEWIVSKALRKDREERYQTAKEILVDLRSLKQRLEFDAEQERSTVPSGPSSRLATGEIETAGERIDKPESSSQTLETSRPTTSAEYLLIEAKRHKLGMILVLAAVIVVIVGAIAALKYIGRSSKTAEPFSRIKVTRLTTSGQASQAAISPDGKYVVHVTGSAGRESLLLRHIATGSDKEIVASNGSDFSWVTFSPGGSYVVYCRIEAGTYPIYQVPVLGGTPRKLTSEDADTPPSFSPDGKRFAFVRGQPQKGEVSLVLANTDGTEERTLTRYKLSDFNPSARLWASPSWSPDGQYIAFAHRTPQGDQRKSNVVTVNVKDGVEKQITSQRWSAIGDLVWLADGSGLIITATDAESGPSRQIWYVSYPDGEARRVTNDTNNYLGLSLTEDSKALVTVQTEQTANLWTAPNGEAERVTQITSSRNEGVTGVAWTPDGRIVYTSGERGYRNIFLMSADGSGQKQLTADTGNNTTPCVTSDGRYIVFSSTRTGAYNIWRMDIDGSNQKQLTNGSRDVSPSCSLDSKWVFYTSTESDRQRLAKVSINGGNPVQLTDYSSVRPLLSPDGKLIACSYINDQERPARYRLAIIPASGGPPLKTFDISESMSEWTPDGRALLYLLTRNGITNIWSQPIDGGPTKQLTDFKSDLIFRFDWSRDGKWLVVARGNVSSDVVLISDLK